MKYKTMGLVFVAAMVSLIQTARCSDRVLYSFDKANSADQWRTVNDGVMGGRSVGNFKINNKNRIEFYGTLSLANNGGFASVRARGSKLGLAEGDSIVARIRGDGREYSLNLHTPRRLTAFSYRARFTTKADEWVEVRLPLEGFSATWFGRVLPGEALDPAEVNGIGILLGDKKAGPFKLEVDWIKVVGPSE